MTLIKRLKENETKGGGIQLRGVDREYIIPYGGKSITRVFRMAIDITNEPRFTVIEILEGDRFRENCEESILNELLELEGNNWD